MACEGDMSAGIIPMHEKCIQQVKKEQSACLPHRTSHLCQLLATLTTPPTTYLLGSYTYLRACHERIPQTDLIPLFVSNARTMTSGSARWLDQLNGSVELSPVMTAHQMVG